MATPNQQKAVVKWLINEFTKYFPHWEVQSYSGRSMYGAYCASVHLNGEDDNGYDLTIGRFFLDIGQAIANELVDTGCGLSNTHRAIFEVLEQYRTDSLGRGSVIYWPSLPYEDDED